jgi:phosphatidylinositol alpha-mannosyltransferase
VKIGFVLDDSLDSTDGVQQYILTLGEWLTNQGHQVHYLVGQTKRTNIKHVHSLSRNIFVRFNGNRMSIPLPAAIKPIKTLLAKEQFDVLHVQMPYSPFMAGKVIKSAPAGTALVGTFHIMPYGRWQTWGAQLLCWLLRGTTARLQQIWSVSRPAQTFATGLGITSTVLPNVINLKKFKTATVKKDGFNIVFLGRLVKRKGVAQLLSAFELVAQTLPKAHLHIGGTGPQAAALKNWLQQHNLSNRVSFDGYIKEADKASYLAAADIAIFPSLGGESFGIVLLEAMAAGAGITLGGNNPGYSSVLATVPEALFNPKNANEVAELIKSFANNASKRQDLYKRQQSLVKQYDVAVVGKKLLSYYQDL